MYQDRAAALSAGRMTPEAARPDRVGHDGGDHDQRGPQGQVGALVQQQLFDVGRSGASDRRQRLQHAGQLLGRTTRHYLDVLVGVRDTAIGDETYSKAPFGGVLGDGCEAVYDFGIDTVHALCTGSIPPDYAMNHAAELLAEVGERIGRQLNSISGH